MRVRRASNGEFLALDDGCLLGAGGEARIYTVPSDPSLAAKLWHKPTEERARKLAVMAANPPPNPMAAQSHSAIAWPVDLLVATAKPNRTVGFLMPRVNGMRPVMSFFNPKTRREQCPLFNYFYLHRTARNLAIAVRVLHERGYVIGDLNESNVLVSETALVTIVDTDSFQVWDAERGLMYRCRVGKPDFTAPELQGKNFARMDREPVQDQFALGVLLFQLLMEGTHPFAGLYRGPGEAPTYEQRIAAGHFPHANDPKAPYGPKPAAPPFESLYPGLQHLFIRCFHDGHGRPDLRPDPQTWQWLLEEAELHLVACWWNEQHIYSDHLPECPWCHRAKLLGGRDSFPALEAVKRREHLRPPKPQRGAPPLAAPATAPARPQPAGALPLPPPIPPSSPSTPPPRRWWQWPRPQKSRRPRPLLGDWNDLAWLAIIVGVLAVLASFWAHLLGFPLGIFAAMLGILGEQKARMPELDGRGRWLARSGLLLGLGTIALAVWRPAS